MSTIQTDSHKKNQQGQAMVEFLVLALALIPLFLLVPYIAKYQDLAHTTQMASRYVAFEAMSRNSDMGSFKPEAELQNEVRRRFFSDSVGRSAAAVALPIKAGDVAAPSNTNGFWRNTANSTPLVANFNDVSVTYGSAAGTKHTDVIVGNEGALTNATFAAAKLKGISAGLTTPGIYRANVSVKVANLPSGLKFLEPFDKLNLSISRNTSVIFNGWAANGAVQLEDRVGSASMLPVGALMSNPAISAASSLGVQLVDFGLVSGSVFGVSGGVRPPDFANLAKWRDMVPYTDAADRLRVPE